MPLPQVRTSRNRLEDFDKTKIAQSLVEETKIDWEHAKKISESVESSLQEMHLKYITAPLIREIVNVKLLEHGFESARNRYTRLGMPVADVRKLIYSGTQENANMQVNPESVHKLMGDMVAKEYTYLNVLPPYLVDAHMSGTIHIHDLDYFAVRPFTFSHDLRFFLKNGIKIDGTGRYTAVSGPARRPEVAVLHAVKVLAAAQANSAGGQCLHYFNTFLAPYIGGMSYEEIKHLVQLFVYELDQLYVARGGQTVFSSINIDMKMPKILQNLPAVTPRGKVEGTYSDYEDEAHTITRALFDVFLEGDSQKKPFLFPNLQVHINPKESYDEEDMLKLSELSHKFGAPYYVVLQDYMPDIVSYQACSFLMPLHLSSNKDDLENGTARGGAMQVVSVNLPKVGYDSNRDDDRLFELLASRMSAARETLVLKRELIHKNMENNLLPFFQQPIDDSGTPYFVPDEQSFVIGMIGMNELVKIHTGSEIHEDQSAWKFALKVMDFMKKRVDEFSQKTGLNFTLARTPAESSAHRLALTDLMNYGDRACVQGDREKKSVYYTNSFHVRPSADIPLERRLELEAEFHPKTSGGAMSHIWLADSDPESILKFTKKFISKTPVQYFAYTKDFSVCPACPTFNYGLIGKCPKCGHGQLTQWSRVTGYYQNITGWNRGKIAELQDRHRYNIGGKTGKIDEGKSTREKTIGEKTAGGETNANKTG